MRCELNRECSRLCPNGLLLYGFAEQAELLEAAAKKSDSAILVREGKVTCRGATDIVKDESGKTISLDCHAEEPVMPIIVHEVGLAVLTDGGLSSTGDGKISGLMHELVGIPYADGVRVISQADRDEVTTYLGD